jgi:outer membrane protein TolC
MSKILTKLGPELALSFAVLWSGCDSLQVSNQSVPSTAVPHDLGPECAGQTPKSQAASTASSAGEAAPAFAEAKELSVDALVQQVLARNPTLPQMIAAAEAASARIPQATSLEDPFFGATVAPASIGSSDVEFGYRLELSQKLPWPGKRGLRGASAQAEARAAGNEVEDARLQLTEAARMAFYDYYFVHRAIEVNQRGLDLLGQIHKAVESRFKVPQLESSQELYQTDVETGRQRERRLLLDRLRRVAIARLNTLLHLPPDLPLPPPPKEVRVGVGLPEASVWRVAALAQRPDLQAVRNHIDAEEASLALARREYYPDFDVMAAYDTIMGNGPTRDLAPQLAVRVNLPIRKTRRLAAVSEAESRVAQRRAELERLSDQVNYEVQQVYEQVRESERVVRLYEKDVLPAARLNVEAALAAYRPGRIPLISLIEAQRNVVGLEDRYHEAVADYFRRLASLERAAGGPAAPPSLVGTVR